MIGFNALPMEDAIAFWKDKVQLSPGEFARLPDEAKLRAFAVSGIAKGAELETVFNSLQKALEKGIPFSKFKEECAGIFESRGWTGQRAWRIDNIFRTNIQTAYNVGHYKQMMTTAGSRPYWQYHAVNDRRTRPLHRALHGKVFPADHAFWNTWFPPNGFRCRCTVTSLSKIEMAAEGLNVETKDPTGGIIEPIDPVSGVRLPARPLMPDQGWDFNPGKSAWGGFNVDGSQGTFSELPGLRTAADFKRPVLTNLDVAKLPGISAKPLPSKMVDDYYKAEFNRLYGDATLLTDPLDEPVILSLRAFEVFKEAGSPQVWKFEKAGHAESIPLLRAMVENPFEIWLTPQINEAGRIRLAKRYISLWNDGSDRVGGFAAFEVVDGVFQGVTSFLPTKKGMPDIAYLEKLRKGVLLYK